MDWSAVFSVTVLHGYIPQILLAEALYTLRLPRRSRFLLRLCIGLPVCAFLAVVIPNIVAQLTAGLFSILIFLLTFALCCFLFESRWTHVLFCCVSAQFTQNLSYNIESLVEMPLGEISLWQTGAISVACMALVYLACYMLFARRIKVIRMDARWVLPMAVATGLFVYAMQFLLQVYGLDGMWVARLPLVACCIFGLCMLYGFLAYKDEQAENDRLEYFLRQESRQYEITRHSIDLINMKAHDLKHHLAQMRAGGGYGQEAFAEISAAVEEYERTVSCGNPTLDVILTEKQYQCEKHGIHFSMMVQGEELAFVHATDLVAIFGNALDNAIECERGISERAKRCVALRAARRGAMIAVHVENYCPYPVPLQDGLPFTTKGDTDFHGFGTKSIRYAAQKYGGTMQIGQENEMFLLNVLLPCPPAKPKEQ